MKQFEQVLTLFSKYGKDLAYLGTVIVGILATITALINIVFNRINKRDELRYSHLNSARISEIKNFISLMVEIINLSSRVSTSLIEDNDDIINLRNRLYDIQLNYLKSSANLVLLVSEKNAVIIKRISIIIEDVAESVINLININIKNPYKYKMKFMKKIDLLLSKDDESIGMDKLRKARTELTEHLDHSRNVNKLIDDFNVKLDKAAIEFKKTIPKLHSMIRKYSGL